MIPSGIRLEAQVAKSGRAKCRICGNFVAKGNLILKIIGYRINESYHPECVSRLCLALGDAIKNSNLPKDCQPVLRAVNGKIKVGYYKQIGEKKYRFTSTQIFKPGEVKKDESEERPNERA